MGPYPYPVGNFSRRVKDCGHQPDPNRRWRETQTPPPRPPHAHVPSRIHPMRNLRLVHW
ncbi:hypothetical protein I307_02904 [Cryptococcus deuterogattii 99/473]|uniref:Uncharacterized protein n=1 Tax=Cryptococcus deuterogattii Ram5 TaxID=1296110 RepID=A0A0D0SZU6_9TREE|nr:hypothetical protein I309_05808 [Cryptococcus deuterogattii LA55]KIR31451.1 hypothetical protein I352_06087 [Cryptococcus deuterogattii MMRL2647]KIR38817.1 hypothetical protein I313_05457 [Cryptococcus deuterogattii Ram5]KIR71001.1 hypothetical protein I310_05415 [Cryptococcus deuterogattii CA1014]KIR90612.1 hypothetical protein I304_05756 [Cryptococcus deuterogattii CBS 10090]KIR97347.1 hypothetical protein L804_05531 [Cryptococcus deuterogattii 2001/935-1]KIY57829.1 hypothetical protein 